LRYEIKSLHEIPRKLKHYPRKLVSEKRSSLNRFITLTPIRKKEKRKAWPDAEKAGPIIKNGFLT